MKNYNIIDQVNPRIWLYIFLSAHLLGWTLLPSLVRFNLPLDAIEGTIWAHHLQLGYDKDPFLNSWLTALGIHFSQPSGWLLYLFSQFATVTCLWVVWRLASTILTPTYALLSVLLLEGVQYFNFHAIDFNDNTLELVMWALITYSFYFTLKKPRTSSWMITGLLAGIGMMAKYYTAALLSAMALLLIVNPGYRENLKKRPLYLGLIVFFMVITPHTIWLFFNDFTTVKYVIARGSSEPHWTNHFVYPYEFIWQQLQVFIPALVIYLLLFLGTPGKKNLPLPETDKSDRQFLIFMGIVPMLLTALLSLIIGTKLRAGWGMPLLSLWTILLFAYKPPKLSLQKLYITIAGCFVLLTTLLSAYGLSIIHSSSTTSANFPGKLIAKDITRLWHERHQTPLSYVAGSRWVGGNIGFYSKDKPDVFIQWDKQIAPWINTNELRKKGAVFIWDMTEHETLPENVKKQYPRLGKAFILNYNWHRDSNSTLSPQRVGIAFLPPG